MDTQDTLQPHMRPTASRPLLGMTILVVEDSRFTCETLRLMCLRSGARIRRADCLASARRHLKVYRPSAAVIDMGLPDGSGLDLISELARAVPRVGVIIGLSGDDRAETEAMAAGADGFLAKPLDSLGQFQETILAALPPEAMPSGPRAVAEEAVRPDRMAFHDDMSHVATLLEARQDEPTIDYVAQFLGGVARSARDTTLERAASDLARSPSEGAQRREKVARLMQVVQARLESRAAI